MSLLARLGFGHGNDSSPRTHLNEAVRERLARLPAERAEYVAAFAGLLVRIAYVDRKVDDAERTALEAQLATRVGLSADEAHVIAAPVIDEAIPGIEYS